MKSLKTFLPICLLCLYLAGFAQKKQETTPFNTALEKIILDFPSAFANVKGEEILKDDSEIRYESRIELPGTEDCMVNANSTGTKKITNWEAVFITTATYEEAEKAYKKLYHQLIACRFNVKSKTPVSLIGKWISPEPDENFSATILTLSSASGIYRKMAIELELVKMLDEWKVNLRVKENG